MAATTQVPLAFALATELAAKTAATLPLYKLPACWEYRIERPGAIWWFGINGHDEPKRFEPNDGLCMGLDVPPYNVAVIVNGWIAGLIDAGGGGLINTDEDDVVEVLQSELDALPRTSSTQSGGGK